jgi:hypothetical protein
MIRPEKLRILRDPHAVAENEVHAILRDVIYLGSSTLYLAQVGDRLWRVQEQNLSRSSYGGEFRPGEMLRIGLPPENATVVS